MVETGAERVDRKQHGAWYTPPELVDTMVRALVTEEFVVSRRATGRPLRVLDPACGDGRFLAAVERTVRRLGGVTELVGVELDADVAGATAAGLPTARIIVGDALDRAWSEGSFDLIVGNPPFLSQLACELRHAAAPAAGVEARTPIRLCSSSRSAPNWSIRPAEGSDSCCHSPCCRRETLLRCVGRSTASHDDLVVVDG